MDKKDLINTHLESARAGLPTTVELARKLIGQKEEVVDVRRQD